MKKEILELLGRFYPQVEPNLIFANNNTIGNMFRFKDRVPLLLSSNIVYKYVCPQCSEAYVGETSRQLRTRVAEHKGVSPRTGLRSCSVRSNIFNHFEETGHFVKDDGFSILFSNCNSSLKLLESIFIHIVKPSLNGSQYSTPLNILS